MFVRMSSSLSLDVFLFNHLWSNLHERVETDGQLPEIERQYKPRERRKQASSTKQRRALHFTLIHPWESDEGERTSSALDGSISAS